MDILEEMLNKQGCINVFGYGSLAWHPEFEYDTSYLGYIDGYERKFWQGSPHHRGTIEKPGIVVTLIKIDEGRCWGRVYVIKDIDKIYKAMAILQTREQKLGHFESLIVPVHVNRTNNVINSAIYCATSKNPFFIGELPLEEAADRIVQSSGISGHNIEYIIRITDFMRENLPEVKDDHLYTLDQLVRFKAGLDANNVLPWHKLLECDTFIRKIKTENEKKVDDV